MRWLRFLEHLLLDVSGAAGSLNELSVPDEAGGQHGSMPLLALDNLACFVDLKQYHSFPDAKSLGHLSATVRSCCCTHCSAS